MSYARLIPVLTLKDKRIIKTIRFDEYRDIGHPTTMGKVFDSQDVDELIFLDISATQEKRDPDWASISAFAEECVMPLTIGGGVSSIEHIRRLLQIGADKVALNTAAFRDPDFVAKAAESFGTQCIVVSIDAKRMPNGGYEVFVEGGATPTGRDPVAYARDMERLGAGEILINSIDRDGTMEGFDLELIRQVADAVGIPVIAAGGCGLLQDLVDAIAQGRASSVACSSLFAFSDNKPIKAKAFMQTAGINVRPI